MTGHVKTPLLVSVIIPAFNVERWIKQCIDSVIAQTYARLEIVVINDGSSDSTPALIDRFAAADQRMVVVHQENQGLSAVRNKGVQICTGDIVFFLDSDDWIHPETIAEAVRAFLDLEPDVVMIRCVKYYESNGAWSGGTDDFYWHALTRDRSGTLTAVDAPSILALYPLAPLKIFRRKFLVEHGLRFIEGIRYEDNPVHAQVFSLNPRYALVPRRYYAWRQGRPGQITAKPHMTDCVTAVTEMLRAGENLHPAAYPYLMIAITRLVCGVARNISDGGERQRFLEKAADLVRGRFSPEQISECLEFVSSRDSVHPGDWVLVRAWFSAPGSLAGALGGGLGRYWGGLGAILAAIRAPSFRQRLADIVQLLKSHRLLVQYSNGAGGETITGLG